MSGGDNHIPFLPAEAEEQLLNAKVILRGYTETLGRRDPEKSARTAVRAAGAPDLLLGLGARQRLGWELHAHPHGLSPPHTRLHAAEKECQDMWHHLQVGGHASSSWQ